MQGWGRKQVAGTMRPEATWSIINAQVSCFAVIIPDALPEPPCPFASVLGVLNFFTTHPTVSHKRQASSAVGRGAGPRHQEPCPCTSGFLIRKCCTPPAGTRATQQDGQRGARGVSRRIRPSERARGERQARDTARGERQAQLQIKPTPGRHERAELGIRHSSRSTALSVALVQAGFNPSHGRPYDAHWLFQSVVRERKKNAWKDIPLLCRR